MLARTRIAVGAVLLALALSGCTGAPRPSASPGTPSPTATPASTVTVTATPSATPTTTSGAKGCANGRTDIPPGASTAMIGDVDGDGRDDTAFYSEDSGGFAYGIRTAAGGVFTLPDDLAGPGVHSGWTAALDAAVGHITVLDDGRTATLHAFVDCRFVVTRGVDGQPYRFGLNGFSDAGTGVACNDRNGGVLLEGVLAKQRADGRYDIRWTHVTVSADGLTATNGETETRWAGLAASDPRVRASMESHCGSAPKVGTSGK